MKSTLPNGTKIPTIEHRDIGSRSLPSNAPPIRQESEEEKIAVFVLRKCPFEKQSLHGFERGFPGRLTVGV